MAPSIWTKFSCLTLVMTSLIAGSVTAASFRDASILQRVNLGVIMTRQAGGLDLQPSTWTHLVKLSLPKERGVQAAMAECRDGVEDILCFMDAWLALQSRLLAAKVDLDIRAAVEFAGKILPRLPRDVRFDSTSLLPGVGDAFGQTLSGVRVFQGSNLTQLTGQASLHRVLSVASQATLASVCRLDVARYRDAVGALSRGRLEDELLGKVSLETVMQGVRDWIEARGLDLTLQEEPVRNIYSSLLVRGYVDDEYLYISLPFKVHPVPRRHFHAFKVSTFPVAAGRGSLHATQIVGLPDYFAIDDSLSTYATLSSDDLAGCLEHDFSRCHRTLVVRPLSEPSCVLGVYRDLAEMIQAQCSFDLVHGGADRSITEILPGLLLLNNVPVHLLDCPKFHRLEWTQALSPCTQCLRVIPCECAVVAAHLQFTAYPCNSNNNRPLCRLEFMSPGDPTDFSALSQFSSEMSSSPACEPRPGESTWVTHTVNMALWMAFGGNHTLKHLRGGDLFAEETDVPFPELESVFQGWDGRLKRRILGERAKMEQSRWVMELTPHDGKGEGERHLLNVVSLLAALAALGMTLVLASRLWHLHRVSRDLDRRLPVSTNSLEQTTAV